MNNNTSQSLLFAMIFAGVFILIALILGDSLIESDDSKLISVWNNEASLSCHFKDGERVVPSDLVEDFSDGVWYFTNGHSKTCKLIKK